MKTLGYIIVFVSDMDRSIAFYRDVLAFPVKHQSHKWTEFDAGGIPSPCTWLMPLTIPIPTRQLQRVIARLD